MSPRQRLAGRARERLGLFTIEEARACGVTDRMRRRMAAAGSIERVHPQVYRFAGHPWSWEARQVAAVVACGDGAVASHAGAASLLGLAVPRGRPEVTVGRTGRPLLEGVQVHRSRALEQCDVTTVSGVACTTGSRTLIDLAARLTPARRIALVDEAICAGVASRRSVHERALALRQGRRGVRTLLEVTHPEAEGTFWSLLERMFAAGIREARLPRPRYNAPVRTPRGLRYADALWEAQQVVAEVHGLRFHAAPAQVREDAERQNEFTLAGYRCLVFTWQDLFEDRRRVMAEIAAAVGVARR